MKTEPLSIYRPFIDLPLDITWLDRFDRSIIHPRLFNSFIPESLKRPPYEKKPSGGTAYILLEASIGFPLKAGDAGHTCGAACGNCYLIRGGSRPDYTPSPTEAIWMKHTLETKGFDVIFTGAELLSLPGHFDAGLFDEKPYLLTSGLVIAANPERSLRSIAKAGINNIQMSLHGAVNIKNIFRGVPSEIVIRAVNNIQAFNRKFNTHIGIVLNITVGKHNLEFLENIADFVLGNPKNGGLNCDGIRFNRHKASGGKFIDLMLAEPDYDEFYGSVKGIRKKYPLSETNKTVNVSGDFGKIKRPVKSGKIPYECPAGIPGGEITIVPRRGGKHEVYSCLEVRNEKLQMGIFYGNQSEINPGQRGILALHTRPFESLKDDRLRVQLTLEKDDDGCIAYVLTQGDSASNPALNYLQTSLNVNQANLII